MMSLKDGITNYVNSGPKINWDKVILASDKISKVCSELECTASEAALAFHQFMVKQTIRAWEEGVRDAKPTH